MRTPSTIESEQDADLKALNAMVAKAEQAISAIDRNLKPEIVAERAVEIRERSIKELAERRKAIVDRAKEAQGLLRRYTPEALRRSARFHESDSTNATMRLAAFETLKRTSTGELIEHLRDAVEAKNVAMAELIRLEFQGRDDKASMREAFVELFSKVEFPDEDAAAPRKALERVVQLERISETSMLSLLRGSSTALERASAGRTASADDFVHREEPSPVAGNGPTALERLAAFRASKSEQASGNEAA